MLSLLVMYLIVLPSQNYVSGTRTAEDSPLNTRHQIIADAVKKMYSTMAQQDENFRFSLIGEKETPDLSSFYYVCPARCSICNETRSEIICRVCCPDSFITPVSFTSMATQSSYSDMIYWWLVSNFEVTGMTPVLDNWEKNNRRENRNSITWELDEVMKRFKYLNKYEDPSFDRGSLIPHNNENFDILEEQEQVCGYYEGEENNMKRERRIVGGSDVQGTRNYPWQLSLATGFMGLFYMHRCGAALIAESWVLTAAHCLYTLGDEPLYVLGGFLHINEWETAQITQVEKIFIHEEFEPDLYEQDIAIVRLSTPVVYTPSLLPVCLPQPTYSRKDDYTTYLGRKAVLTGWGRQWSDGPLSTQLQMVKLPVITNSMCMNWYNTSGSKQYIPESTFLCAGWEEGVMDACGGDSGGPLIVTREDGRAEVMGVVSWGIGCGIKGRPGVYTRVSQFIPWIKDKIFEYTVLSSIN